MGKKVLVTGVECSGKTTLAEGLSDALNCRLVEEFSRTFLTYRGGHYQESDLLMMAQKQWELEQREASSYPLVVCDTSLIVYKIWSMYKYGRCHSWIDQKLEFNHWDIILLPSANIPYEEDPLRENREERALLFQMYLEELERLGFAYSIVSGSPAERLKFAIQLIESRLK